MRRPILLGIAAILAMASQGVARVKPASIISDNMVIQRGRNVPIFGTAAPGEEISVELAGGKSRTTADSEGNWRITLDLPDAGGPYEMIVNGSNRVVIRNVVIGDVWVCSGQSNMAFRLKKSETGPEAIASANQPMLRFYKHEASGSDKPETNLRGRWVVCTPETAPECFAVAFFFARKLQQETGVPIGLVLASVGASSAENWTPTKVVESDDTVRESLAPVLKGLKCADWKEAQTRYATWIREVRFKDTGNDGVKKGWAEPGFNDGEWETMALPGLWQGGGKTMKGKYDIDAGVVWFRRQVDIPESWQGRDISLHFDRIDNCDTTYFNGVEVGQTSGDDADWQREYYVPGRLVKPGKAVIAVRVYNLHGPGGFEGDPDQMYLECSGDGGGKIPLAGDWRLGIERRTPWWSMQSPISHYRVPSIYYNGVIAPLTRYAIKGVIWYQGEGNVGRAEAHKKLFPAMIRSWREAWGQGDFPFLFVQLARIGKKGESKNAGWAELRETQRATLSVTNTTMAVSYDVSDGNLHPKRKKEVGQRLALGALATVYGKDLEWSGPVAESVTRENGKVRIAFSHVTGGLKTVDDEPVCDFSVIDRNGNAHRAESVIEGNDVIVWSESVQVPVEVRYGWTGFPVGNLCNGAGLPASPFRMKIDELESHK